MLKTKTAKKWLPKETKASIGGALKKHLPRISVKALLSSSTASIPSETVKEAQIRNIENERIKAQAMEFARRIIR